MKKRNANNLLSFTLSTLAATAPLQGAAVIYEGFDYETSTVSGNDGGLGFSGAWTNTRNNPNQDAAPGLTYEILETSGGNARGAAWSGLSRPIGSTLLDANLLDNGATLWFSVIMDLSGANLTNADLNIALTNSDRFVPGSFGDRFDLDGGTSQGIGTGHTGGNIRGAWWIDGNADSDAERNLSAASSLQLSSNGVDNPTGALIVGKIEWGATADATETITLYNPDADLTLGEPVLAVTETGALDQVTFDTLAIQFKDGTPRIDEIRFGATSADVLPTPGGPAVDPVITSITRVDATTYELTILASANTEFEVVSSESLDLDNGTPVTGLTQGNIADPGTINSDLVTTDENGNATFRMTSAVAKNFVRIQPPVAIAQ